MKKRTGKKGLVTEEILRRYFIDSGFYVCRGLTLKFETDEITDIDIWTYERSAAFGRRRLIIDVKDRARPHAAERMLFVMGLHALLEIEGCGVATTDKRRSIRNIAQKHKLLWIDGDDLQALKSKAKYTDDSRYSEEQLLAFLSEMDRSRGNKFFCNTLNFAKSSLADRFGVASGNFCLDATIDIALEAIKAHPGSPQAEYLYRLTLFLASMCSASYDFVSAEKALRSTDERRKFLEVSLKFGADAKGFKDKILWMENVVSANHNAGPAIAKAVTTEIFETISTKEFGPLSEVIEALSRDEGLFESAIALEGAAFKKEITQFGSLDVKSASILGAILDFGGIDRRVFINTVKESES